MCIRDSPYNFHVSGTLTRSGQKNEQGGLVYLRLDPTGGRLGAGSWGLNATRMGRIRDHILENPKRFERMTSELEAVGLSFNQDDVLTNMPRGYSQHVDHDLAWALRMKNFAVQKPMTRVSWVFGRQSFSCLLYTSPSPRDRTRSRMPSSA